MLKHTDEVRNRLLWAYNKQVEENNRLKKELTKNVNSDQSVTSQGDTMTLKSYDQLKQALWDLRQALEDIFLDPDLSDNYKQQIWQEILRLDRILDKWI
jgi:ABC-type phosphate transport system auxiliary subunit